MYNNQQNNVIAARRAASALALLKTRLYETAAGQVYYNEVVSKMNIDSVNNIETLANMTDQQLNAMVISYGEYLEETEKIGVSKTAQTASEVEATLSELFGGVDVELDEFVQKFDGSFESIQEYIRNKKGEFVKSGEAIATCISDGINNCRPLIEKAAQALVTRASQIVNAGIQRIKSSINNLSSWGGAASAGTKVAGAINVGGSSSARTAGENISSGVSEGMRSGVSNVIKTAASIAGSVVSTISKVLKIHSPSRATYALGKYSIQGFVNAFFDYESKANEAGKGIADSAMNGLRKALSKIQDVVNNDVETQPTIRPVLDMGDLMSGVNQIDSMFAMTPSVGLLSKVGGINARMNALQNGTNSDIIDAINGLKSSIRNMSGDTYNVNGITYDDGSNITNAVKTLVRAARVERRR